MDLPKRLRDLLIVRVDEYLEDVNDDPEPADLAEVVVDALLAGADELGLDDAADVVARIEEHAGLDDTLLEALEYEFANDEDLDVTGDAVASLLRRICRIAWVEHDEFADERSVLPEDLEAWDGEDDDELADDGAEGED